MKVDTNRIIEIGMDHCSCDVTAAITQAVREQTEWLMELVCGKCGEVGHEAYKCPRRLEFPIGIGVLNLCTRAEHLHRKGERP